MKSESFSNRVRSFRKRAGLSQEQVGKLLGVSGNYIYQIEAGKKQASETLESLFRTMEDSPAYGQSQVLNPAPSATTEDPAIYGRKDMPPSRTEEDLIALMAELLEDMRTASQVKRRWLAGQIEALAEDLNSIANGRGPKLREDKTPTRS